jgi:hypothetical protein
VFQLLAAGGERVSHAKGREGDGGTTASGKTQPEMRFMYEEIASDRAAVVGMF